MVKVKVPRWTQKSPGGSTMSILAFRLVFSQTSMHLLVMQHHGCVWFELFSVLSRYGDRFVSVLYVWTDQSVCKCVMCKYKTQIHKYKYKKICKLTKIFCKYETDLQIHKQIPQIKKISVNTLKGTLLIRWEVLCDFYPLLSINQTRV